MDRRVRLAAHGFSLDDILGQGSFAEVFKGWSREGVPVAVKRIAKTKLGSGNNRRLLEQEIFILQTLRHPNIVQLLAHEETEDFIYLVMEYCNGGDLASHLSKQSTIPEPEIRTFLTQLVDALTYLEHNNILHRDLKPQNILLHIEGENISLKIADFGFARHLYEEDLAATFCGSPLYMAPEVLDGDAYNSLADLWSLGAILYQCFTGSPPFRAPNIKALKEILHRNQGPVIPETASPHLAEVISGLLQLNPRDRMTLAELSRHPFLRGGEGAIEDIGIATAAEGLGKDFDDRSYVLVDPLFVDVNTMADSMERRLRLAPSATGRDPQELVTMLHRVTLPASLIIAIANSCLSAGQAAAGDSVRRAQGYGEALVLYGKTLTLLRKGISNLRVLIVRTSLTLTRDLVSAVQTLRRQFNDSMARIEEIRAEMTSAQMHSVRTSVDQLLYRQAVLLCRDAASYERRTDYEDSSRMYTQALLLLEVVLQDAQERSQLRDVPDRDVSNVQSLLLSLEERLRHSRTQLRLHTQTRATSAGATSAGAGAGAGAGSGAIVSTSPPNGGIHMVEGTTPPTTTAIGMPPTSRDRVLQRTPSGRALVVGLGSSPPHIPLPGTSPVSLGGSPKSGAIVPTAVATSSPSSGLVRSPSSRNFKASFCGSCGTQFSSEDQRFCMRCGNPRVVALEGDPTVAKSS